MKLNLKTISIYSCALTFAAALAFAQQTPTVISPTAGSAPNGIAPNGIAATPTTGVLFTQPFAGTLQSRGAYAITIPGGVVSTDFLIPSNGVTAPNGTENGIAIVPTPALSGFTSGDVYATGASAAFPGNDAIYKNGALFVDNIPASTSGHQTALAFDTVGTFNGDLIVTADSSILVYNGAGALQATYTGPPSYVLQASTVAPTDYVTAGANGTCPGCIFVTAEPFSNINNPTPSGNGEILTVSPAALNLSAAVLFATTTGIPEPESIQFVTSNSTSCNIGGFSLFASGYSTSLNDVSSTTGAILAWTPTQLANYVGHYLVQNEESSTGVSPSLTPTPGTIYEDAGLSTQKVFSNTTYQLEDTAIIQCPLPAGGCPATQGFWHKAANWPNVSANVDGVIYNGTTHSMTIGGKTYTQAQLVEFMPSGSLHSGGYINAISQFIAAVLNIAAGAQHTAGIDAAISAINSDLTGVTLVTGPPVKLGTVPSTVQAELNGFETTLDNYNSAVGLGCSEGSGLNIPKGK